MFIFPFLRHSPYNFYMSIRIKKKSRMYKLLEEESLLDRLVFGFLGGQCLSMLCLDKIIFHAIKGRVRHHVRSQVKSFTDTYAGMLEMCMQKSRCLKIYRTPQGDIKLHVPVYFKVEKLQPGRQYSLEYSYEITRKGKSKQHLWSTEFYICRQPQRSLWLYREENKHSKPPSYLMDVPEVRSDDVLCINLPFYSCGSPVTNIKMYPLKSGLGQARECQVETLHSWKAIEQSGKTSQLIQEMVNNPAVKLRYVSAAQTELQSSIKFSLVCEQAFEATSFLDLLLEGHQLKSPVDICLKKKGSYGNENNKLDLRVGDTLTVYLMKT